MRIKVFQKGFNYSQDGTGNRLVYHLQGCNFHCPWCANPEGIAVKGSLWVTDQFLIDTICPHGAIRAKQIDRSLCETCNTRECISLHRTRGIRLSYQEYEIESILDEVRRSAALFYDGGGVTLSGGEPTLQFDAVRELLSELKNMGIHTAIETNASHPRLAVLFPLIDLLIMDFKHYDDEVSASVTGVGNAVVKANILKAMQAHQRLLIRIPVVRGFNDSESDMRNFVAFFQQQKTANTSFEFLPFHEYGRDKWQQCGLPYTVQDGFVGPETIAEYERLFAENNFTLART
ncbi:MAG: glycyl-radical enzyme activating protein [Chloroflexi bacterium]|nr:glycyl-radical enzyme activating protein [Chloroflexota bacterium]